MTLHVGPLPAGDKRHLKALAEASNEFRVCRLRNLSAQSAEESASLIIEAYFKALGVRLVDASEVAEALSNAYHPQNPIPDHPADFFLTRFGGGDER